MIKILFFMFIVVVFLGCAENEGKFSCASITLNGLSVGSNINEPEFVELFSTVTPSRYQSGSFCQDTYDFNQFNPDTYDWCYYIQVDVDCDTGIVDSIYNGT